MFDQKFLEQLKENFINEVSRFILDENLSNQEKIERFEALYFHTIYFPQFVKELFEEFKQKIENNIKEIDPNFTVIYDSEFESFYISNNDNYTFYIVNSLKGDHGVGLEIEKDNVELNKILEKNSIDILEETCKALKKKFTGYQVREMWEEHLENWGGLLAIQYDKPTGWNPDLLFTKNAEDKLLKCLEFYKKYITYPEKTVQFYYKIFADFYEIVNPYINKLMERIKDE